MYKHIPLLIVDDEPINLKRAIVALKDDFELHFAKSGKEAIEYLQNKKVELILLDIVMEEMDGFEVAKRLKSDPKTSEIPIIFLTGDNSEETIEKAFEMGAVDFITKPFRDKELLIRVKNRVETQQLKQNLQSSLQRNEHLLHIVNSYLPYLKTDPKGVITEISPSLSTMLLSDVNLVGKNVNILKSGHMPQEFYEEL
jgi:PleD family two-component response regulator